MDNAEGAVENNVAGIVGEVVVCTLVEGLDIAVGVEPLPELVSWLELALQLPPPPNSSFFVQTKVPGQVL